MCAMTSPKPPLRVDDRRLYITALVAYRASLDIKRKPRNLALRRAERDAEAALVELRKGLRVV